MWTQLQPKLYNIGRHTLIILYFLTQLGRLECVLRENLHYLLQLVPQELRDKEKMKIKLM